MGAFLAQSSTGVRGRKKDEIAIKKLLNRVLMLPVFLALVLAVRARRGFESRLSPSSEAHRICSPLMQDRRASKPAWLGH